MPAIIPILTAPLRLALDFALPSRCPGCGAIVGGDHRFCVECWRGLEFLNGPACGGCGGPMPQAAGWDDTDRRCATCLVDPPVLDGVRAAVVYGPVARALAIRLKHGRRPGMAEMMARQMARLLPADGDDGHLIVPVPLHRWRIWQRGFNQSALIAGRLGVASGLPVSRDVIRRHRATPLLRGLGPKARERAVRGAFSIARPADVRDRTIWLVDDVFTTGATANACARILKKAGARRVTLIAWARVMRTEAADDFGLGVDISQVR